MTNKTNENTEKTFYTAEALKFLVMLMVLILVP